MGWAWRPSWLDAIMGGGRGLIPVTRSVAFRLAKVIAPWQNAQTAQRVNVTHICSLVGCPCARSRHQKSRSYFKIKLTDHRMIAIRQKAL
jgi:hypothetical protein